MNNTLTYFKQLANDPILSEEAKARLLKDIELVEAELLKLRSKLEEPRCKFKEGDKISLNPGISEVLTVTGVTNGRYTLQRDDFGVSELTSQDDEHWSLMNEPYNEQEPLPAPFPVLMTNKIKEEYLDEVFNKPSPSIDLTRAANALIKNQMSYPVKSNGEILFGVEAARKIRDAKAWCWDMGLTGASDSTRDYDMPFVYNLYSSYDKDGKGGLYEVLDEWHETQEGALLAAYDNKEQLEEDYL